MPAQTPRAQGKSGKELRAAHIQAIKTSEILNRLNKQALDSDEMSAKAITAAGILLRKTLPDVKVIEADVDVSMTVEVINFGEGDEGKDPE